MTISARVGTLQCPSGTGTSAVSGVGFQPQALIFWYTTRTSDGSAANAQMGMGIATAATERYAWGFDHDDNVATQVVQRAVSKSHCVRLTTDDAGTTGIEADLASLDGDGFTLDWTIVTSGADVHYLALGGMTDAKAHDFTFWTSTGSKAVTGVGFQPDALLVLVGGVTADTADGADVVVGISATDGTTHATMGLSLDDFAGAASGFTRIETGEFLTLPTALGITNGTADFTSFDSDGFTVNVTDAYTAAFIANALALDGASVKVGSITVPGGTGQQATTGIGFRPAAVLFFGGNTTFSSSVQDLFAPFIGGGSGAANQAVVSAAHVDASDPTQADHDSDTTAVIKALTAGTPTTDYEAALVSLDSDGFTLDWATVAGSDQIVYVAFGPAAEPTTTPLPRRVASTGHIGPASSDLLVFDIGGSNERRVPTSDLACSWAVSEMGSLSCFVAGADARASGVTAPLGKWCRFEHPTAGIWAGRITVVTRRAGGFELTGNTFHCLLKKRLTLRTYRQDTATAGDLWIRLLSDFRDYDEPLWFNTYGADGGGDPVAFEFRGDDAYDATQALAEQGGMEWHVDEDRNAAMRFRVGSDLSATVHLVGGYHVTDEFEVVEDLWAIANSILGVAGDADYERSAFWEEADSDSIKTYGRLQESLILPGVADKSTIEPRVRAELARRTGTVGSFSLTLVDVDRCFSWFREGDSISATVGDPALSFKGEVLTRDLTLNDGTMRITGHIEEVRS